MPKKPGGPVGLGLGSWGPQGLGMVREPRRVLGWLGYVQVKLFPICHQLFLMCHFGIIHSSFLA